MPETLRDVVCATLRAELRLGQDDSIDPDDRLDLLPNADSVRLMRSVSKLERRFEVELEDDEIRDAETVNDLVVLFEAALAVSGAS